MSQGLWAIGSKLEIEDPDTPNTFNQFPEVITMGFNRGTRDDIDLTNHDSPPPFTEYVKGFATGAEITFTFNVIPGNTVQQDLEDYWLSETPFKVRIIYNDDDQQTYSFSAHLGAYSTQHDARDAHRGNATLTCTGAWVRSTGGS